MSVSWRPKEDNSEADWRLTFSCVGEIDRRTLSRRSTCTRVSNRRALLSHWMLTRRSADQAGAVVKAETGVRSRWRFIGMIVVHSGSTLIRKQKRIQLGVFQRDVFLILRPLRYPRGRKTRKAATGSELVSSTGLSVRVCSLFSSP